MNSAIPSSPHNSLFIYSTSILSIGSCSPAPDGRHAHVQEAHTPTLSTAPTLVNKSKSSTRVGNTPWKDQIKEKAALFLLYLLYSIR